MENWGDLQAVVDEMKSSKRPESQNYVGPLSRPSGPKNFQLSRTASPQLPSEEGTSAIGGTKIAANPKLGAVGAMAQRPVHLMRKGSGDKVTEQSPSRLNESAMAGDSNTETQPRRPKRKSSSHGLQEAAKRRAGY